MLTHRESFLYPDCEHENAFSDVSELEILRHYGSSGLLWANSAVREAMSSAIEQPSLVITQTLECLQLYWFGIGNLRSCSLCLGKFAFLGSAYYLSLADPGNFHYCAHSSRLSFLPPPWIQSADDRC